MKTPYLQMLYFLSYKFVTTIVAICVIFTHISVATTVELENQVISYPDGRPAARYRLNATDQGAVLLHGNGPGQCDYLGARDAWVWEENGSYYMHYDGAGTNGWLACLATSNDLINWTKQGAILSLGSTGQEDSASASYGLTYKEGNIWHMFYLGTPNVSPAPDYVPSFPYLTMKATASSPIGPWTKQPSVIPFRTQPNTYYSVVASPGQIIPTGNGWMQFFSATDDATKRTLGIARTSNLNGSWTVNPNPALPINEQIENSALHYEPSSQTWWLFTNHIGLRDGMEYTDAIWVYWSSDLNIWNPDNKAIVLDGKNCTWSKHIVGLPSIQKIGQRLAVFYDGNNATQMPSGIKHHMNRDIGVAWLDLPLVRPVAFNSERGNPLFADNFNTANTINFDAAPTTDRLSGVLAKTVVARSTRNQHRISNNQLRMSDGPTSEPDAAGIGFESSGAPHNWAAGSSGNAILEDNGLRVEFDFTPTDTISSNWVAFCIGIAGGTVPSLRILNQETDYGILLRNNGQSQRFQNGNSFGLSTTIPAVARSHHFIIDCMFNSFADGASVTARTTVDKVEIANDTFEWNANGGVVYMELENYQEGTLVDNLTISTLRGSSPPLLNKSITRLPSGEITIGFTGASNTSYRVTKSPDLVEPFSSLTSPQSVLTNTSGLGSVTIPVSEAFEERGFYRIESIPFNH